MSIIRLWSQSCVTVWGELSATSAKSLQRLQNRTARIVFRRDSSKDTFNVLGWTELEQKGQGINVS